MKLNYTAATQSGFFEREGVQGPFTQALNFSFSFEVLSYDSDRGTAFRTSGPTRKRLTPEQRSEVESAIAGIAPPAARSLLQVKKDVREEFNLLREITFAAGVEFQGHLIDTDPASVHKINGAVTMALIAKGAGAPFSIGWTAADDTTVTLDADGMIAMGLAVGTYADTLHQRTRAAKDALDSATTVEEARAIVW